LVSQNKPKANIDLKVLSKAAKWVIRRERERERERKRRIA